MHVMFLINCGVENAVMPPPTPEVMYLNNLGLEQGVRALYAC